MNMNSISIMPCRTPSAPYAKNPLELDGALQFDMLAANKSGEKFNKYALIQR